MTIDTKNPRTGAQAVIAQAADPARRKDVLFRVRHEPGHEASTWWSVGAFVGVCVVIVGLLTLIPGGQ